VKILLDTNTPAPPARSLRGHEVFRTGDLGWQSFENGALLSVAEDAGLDVLVTCDQNVPLQQNLAERRIALVVLSTNHWPTIRAVATRIAVRIDFVQRGQIIRIDIEEL
jgi:hypothetical protein